MRGMTIDLQGDIVVHRLPVWRRSHRIAIVTETYPPEVNGVAMSLARLVAGLNAREHELQLIRPRQREATTAGSVPRIEEFLTGGWPIPSYPNLRMGVPSKRALVQLWSLRRPDVVHIATEGPLGWSALQAARRLKLPVTSDFRTNFHAYGQHYGLGWLARPIMAYLLKFHNRTVCTMVPTESLRAQLSALGFERLHVVGRGVDTRLFGPQRRSESLRKEWGVAAEAPVMVCVGRLAPEKNLKTVLEAYAALAGVRPDAKLVFVGDGPMRADLQARCPNAILSGQRHGEDLAAHYASADLFVFPSLTETYGNVTAEAMASGLPVVAFDCAAAGQLIHCGHNGVLVPRQDSAHFTRAALSLALDGPRRAALGTAARATALEHGWADVVRRFEALLTQAIDRACDGASAVAAGPQGDFVGDAGAMITRA